jgi:STE24 endopeptidase
MDQVKTILISLALGIPLLAILFRLVDTLGENWWIAGWGVVMLFQLFFTALFPVLFVPLFYKLTPLSEGKLKERLIELANKVKFKMSGIFTIDASKRSTHSNAFFAGIGKAKRIVLFDTLVKNLTISEIIAVMGHEMGHNKLHHVLKNLLLGAVSSFVGFFILSKVLAWPPFFHAFGVSTPSAHAGLVLFALFSGVFIFPLNPLTKWLSRKHEYESDQFSAKVTGDPESMVSSLVKLTKDNLANLTPHPWYSFYHYSHPTTTERAEALKHMGPVPSPLQGEG